MTLLFIGRSTFDLGYACPEYPSENGKLSATHFWSGAGGCALNAAVTARALGSEVRLVTLIGSGPFAAAVRDELAGYGVPVDDFAPDQEVLPVSSIVVVPGNATRTIVDQQPPQSLGREVEVESLLAGATMLLTDGWLPELAFPLCRAANARNIPVVLDGGSWKPWSMELVTHVDYAIVSQRFRAPPSERCWFRGPYFARTRGEGPIQWDDGEDGDVIDPPLVEAVDTLGAGDVYHGAFCHYLARGADFPTALERAAAIAAQSCRHFGPRAWIAELA